MTPEEVLRRHLQRSRSGSDDEFLEGYREESFLIHGDRVLRGLDGVRSSYEQLKRELPDASFDYKLVVVEENVGLVEWSATSDTARVDDGVDSYVIRDDYIHAQTIHYSLTTTGADASS